MGRSDGFPLGSTIQSKTKGIWMWIGDHPEDPTKALLLLDTEGLADPEKGSKDHDVKLVILTILLSTLLVYNSKGNIDSTALEMLNLSSELAQFVKTKGRADEETELVSLFPQLVWAVRDHFLDLEVNGEKLKTSDEYLEHCLASKHGISQAVQNHNRLTDVIKSMFSKRHCFVFPIPCRPRDLKMLEELRFEDLEYDFRKQTDVFIKFILDQRKAKQVQGNEIKASALPTLIAQYLESINKNVPLVLEYTFDMVTEIESSRLIDEAMEMYKSCMEDVQLPTSAEKLESVSARAKEVATRHYSEHCLQNMARQQEFASKLSQRLSDSFEKFARDNRRKSKERCEAIINDLSADVRGKYTDKAYSKHGGYIALMDEMTKTKEKYFSNFPETDVGPCKNESWDAFQQEV